MLSTSSGTTESRSWPAVTTWPTSTVRWLITPLAGARMVVYVRFSSACSSAARICFTRAVAESSRQLRAALFEDSVGFDNFTAHPTTLKDWNVQADSGRICPVRVSQTWAKHTIVAGEIERWKTLGCG